MLVQQHDLICIQESRLDDLDSVSIPGYQFFVRNRTAISRFRSGGITLIVKDTILPYIHVIKSESKLIMWFIISKLLTGKNEDLLCGIVYIPPSGSRYANPDPYLELQNELNKFGSNYENVLLLGDFNSRTSNLDDFVLIDEFICDIYGDDELFRESLDIFQCLDKSNIPLLRKSADNVTNAYGYQMLDF